MAETSQVKLAFYRAHVRRRFYELAAAGPAPIATEALERIKTLYAVEAEIRGQTPDARHAVRQERTRPGIEALEPWLRAKLKTISQKTKLAGSQSQEQPTPATSPASAPRRLRTAGESQASTPPLKPGSIPAIPATPTSLNGSTVMTPTSSRTSS